MLDVIAFLQIEIISYDLPFGVCNGSASLFDLARGGGGLVVD